MALLHEVRIAVPTKVELSVVGAQDVPRELVKGLVKEMEKGLKEQVARSFWTWYRDNAEMVVFTQKVWFVTVNVRVKQLGFVFEKLLGPEPVQ